MMYDPLPLARIVSQCTIIRRFRARSHAFGDISRVRYQQNLHRPNNHTNMSSAHPQIIPLAKESSLLNAPREVRDMITAEVVLAQGRPYILSSKLDPGEKEKTFTGKLAKINLVASQRIGMAQTNRQLRAEVDDMIRFTAFRSSAATILQVYNFNMRRVTRFVGTLSPREIVQATRNESIHIHFINFDHDLAFANGRASMVEWAHLCESLGLRVRYVAYWTSSSIPQCLNLLRGSREGRKILDVLGARSIQTWTWEKFVAGSRL